MKVTVTISSPTIHTLSTLSQLRYGLNPYKKLQSGKLESITHFKTKKEAELICFQALNHYFENDWSEFLQARKDLIEYGKITENNVTMSIDKTI